jgi:tetratricopeptide (TPR) repeat protein
MPRTAFRCLPALLLLAACSSNAAKDEDSVDWLVQHGRYEEAVTKAAAAAEKHPNDAKLAQVHRDATFAWLLEQGRRQTFLDNDFDALVFFSHALEVAPDRPEARMWIQKTRHKLADTWLEKGLELHASDKLEAAIEAYDTALRFEPDNRSAQTGLAEATLAVNYRTGLGQAYYDQGTRSLSDARLAQANHEYAAADKYLDDEKVDARKRQVNVELADARTSIAAQLEQDEKYEAARNEYRLASRLDPNNTRALEGKARCEIESHASELQRGALNDITRNRLDEAMKKADEAGRVTTAQKERVEGLKVKIQEARYDTYYKEALSLERDGKYSEAVARYGDLLALAAYYKDALTRKETLEDFITRADNLYKEAAAETDPAKRSDVLRQILQFWPDYRDVKDQLRALTVPSSG